MKLDPHLVEARDLLTSIDLQNGQTEKAFEQSRETIALDPKDQQAVYHLIVALRKTDEKDQIPALLKRLMELRADSAGQPGAKRFRLTVAKEAEATSNQP